MCRELLVDHGVGTLVAHVRLLHVYPKCIMVDRCPERERHDFSIHTDRPTDQVEIPEMMQRVRKGAALVVQLLLLVFRIVRLVPLTFQFKAFRDDLRGDREVFVCIKFLEIVDMVSGLVDTENYVKFFTKHGFIDE